MSVRSTGSSLPPSLPPPAKEKSAAAPKNTLAKGSTPTGLEKRLDDKVDNLMSKLPDTFHKEGEKSGDQQFGEFNKSGSLDKQLYTPGTPTKGSASSVLSSALGMLPSVEKSGSFDADASVFKKEGSFGALGGKVGGDYSVSVLEARATGTGSVSFKDGALSAQGQLQAQATLFDVSAHAHADLGPLHAEAEAHAYAGAKANVEGGVTIDPKSGTYNAAVNAQAFVGVQAGVSGKANLGDFGSVSGGAAVKAGIGAEFHASAGIEKGHLKVSFGFGAALGIGFKLNFAVDINFKKIGDAIKNFIKKPFDLAKKAADAVKNFFKGGIKNIGNKLLKVGEGIKNAGKKIASGLKSVGKALKGIGKKLGGLFKKHHHHKAAATSHAAPAKPAAPPTAHHHHHHKTHRS